jgi:hypothetical protein
MHAEDRIAGKTLEQTVVDHRPRSANAFLSRLEDEIHRTVEIACFGQVFRRAQ